MLYRVCRREGLLGRAWRIFWVRMSDVTLKRKARDIPDGSAHCSVIDMA